MGDTTGLITRWNLDGVTWGRNTDPDGTIYLSLTQPSATEFSVTLYQDQALTQQVASGQLALPAASFPASIGVAGPSGLSGTIEISAATPSQAISLGAMPELAAWQLQTLRADWLTEDHPADGYTDGTTVVPLAALPAGLTIPAALQPGISYNSGEGLLISTGVMTPDDPDPAARPGRAGRSGRPGIRQRGQHAVRAVAAAAGDRPRRDRAGRLPRPGPRPRPRRHGSRSTSGCSAGHWVDAQLTALSRGRHIGTRRDRVHGMLSWAAQARAQLWRHDRYPMGRHTPVGGLENLWENLAQATDARPSRRSLRRSPATSACSIQAFNRLMDLRHQDQAAAADPRSPALSDADWSEVASLLVEAAKTRFFAAWRAEEDALALPLRPLFGPSAFIVSLTEPQAGDWPPVPPPGTPLIDPTTVPLTGLPDPIAGGQAVQLWQQRQGDVAALTTSAADRQRDERLPGDAAAGPGRPPAGARCRSTSTPWHSSSSHPDPAVVAAATDGDQHPALHDRGPVPDDHDREDDGRLRQPARSADGRAMAAMSTRSSPPRRRRSGSTRMGRSRDGGGPDVLDGAQGQAAAVAGQRRQRSQWHAALAQRSQPPIIDPDLIGPADMVSPVTGDPAFSLWRARNSWLFAQTAVPPPGQRRRRRHRPAGLTVGAPARPGGHRRAGDGRIRRDRPPRPVHADLCRVHPADDRPHPVREQHHPAGQRDPGLQVDPHPGRQAAPVRGVAAGRSRAGHHPRPGRVPAARSRGAAPGPARLACHAQRPAGVGADAPGPGRSSSRPSSARSPPTPTPPKARPSPSCATRGPGHRRAREHAQGAWPTGSPSA